MCLRQLQNSSTDDFLSETELEFLHTGYGYLRFYLAIENLSLPMLSYLGRQVTPSCEIASKRIQGLLEAYLKNNK